MKSTSFIYNNSLITKEEFIDTILTNIRHSQIPTCKIKEAPNFYNITIESFSHDEHLLEISYRNKFLILTMKLQNNKKLLFERIFYLKDIDSNNILLYDHKTQLKLIIPKIQSY